MSRSVVRLVAAHHAAVAAGATNDDVLVLVEGCTPDSAHDQSARTLTSANLSGGRDQTRVFADVLSLLRAAVLELSELSGDDFETVLASLDKGAVVEPLRNADQLAPAA
jgi:hypothetical protein